MESRMKKIIAAVLAAGMAMGVAASADAAQGCGRGGHRGPYGHCRPNYGPRGYGHRAPVLIIGQRYDRGYWDGHRYWRERYRHHGGWRYR
jgi:hypothetical protein